MFCPSTEGPAVTSSGMNLRCEEQLRIWKAKLKNIKCWNCMRLQEVQHPALTVCAALWLADTTTKSTPWSLALTSGYTLLWPNSRLTEATMTTLSCKSVHLWSLTQRPNWVYSLCCGLVFEAQCLCHSRTNQRAAYWDVDLLILASRSFQVSKWLWHGWHILRDVTVYK